MTQKPDLATLVTGIFKALQEATPERRAEMQASLGEMRAKTEAEIASTEATLARLKGMSEAEAAAEINAEVTRLTRG